MFLHVARLFSYIACLTHVLVLGQDLAVVRPYASLSEVSSLESSFLPGPQVFVGLMEATFLGICLVSTD